MPNVNTLLDDHVVLKYEMVDRIFLNGTCPSFRRQTSSSGSSASIGAGYSPLRAAGQDDPRIPGCDR
jgi:hypothetical protein